jgi:hypothetical protein
VLCLLAVQRLALFALARGVEHGQSQHAFAALKGFDPVLRLAARGKIRGALSRARLMTNQQDEAHQMRLAFIELSGRTLVADFDDVEAVQAEQTSAAAALVPPRRGPWLTLGVSIAVALAAVAAVLTFRLTRPFDPRATAGGEVFGKDVPDFVVALSRDDAAKIAEARARATGAAPKKALGEPVVQSLDRLLDATVGLRAAGLEDPKARDAYDSSTAGLNRALAEQNRPYFVDADIFGTAQAVSPLLLGFYVQSEAQVQSGTSSDRVVHLWRLDKLNLNQHYYGYTRPSTPAAIVLLDQIESDLVRDVLPALPASESMHLVDEETEIQNPPWVAKVNERGAKLVREYFSTVPEGRDASVQKVGELLARRRALVAKWRTELAGLGHILVVPERLVPEADYAEELSLRVPRAGLHEWDALHDELLTRANLSAFERLRNHYVASVERHEVQHRLDYRRDLVPVPSLLAELLGVENPLDAPYGTRPARARDEMSAFLASVIDSGPSPALELALMARHVFAKHSLGNAYSYAVLGAFIGIARELKIDTERLIGWRRIRRENAAALFLALTERPPDQIRKAARRFYHASYGQPLPAVKTTSKKENASWRH